MVSGLEGWGAHGRLVQVVVYRAPIARAVGFDTICTIAVTATLLVGLSFGAYVGRSYKGLCVSKSCYPPFECDNAQFKKLFVLLYADYTIILDEAEHD